MDIKELFEKIKRKVLSLYEKLREFYEDNQTLSLIIVLITVLVVLLIILLSIFAGKAKKNKKNTVTQEQLILSEDILLPGRVEQNDEYLLSRTTNEKWNEDEAEEWFYTPEADDIENLSTINDNMVNDILKATP